MSLSNTKSKGSTHDLHGEGSGKNLEMFLLRKRKKVTLPRLMNSNMIKPEKSDHLHLVYHITVPLNIKDVIFQQLQENNLKLKDRVSCLEDKVIQLQTKNNYWSIGVKQYRRNNLEIEEIPNSMSNDEFVKTAVAILNTINVKLDSSDMETSHRIGRW